MPLVKATLEQGIKSKLETEFKSTTVKTSLRKLLDGDSAAGALSSAKNISSALTNIKNATSAMNAGTSDNPASQAATQAAIKKFTANEWANAIADSISEWMAKDIAPIIAKTIADQVDTYVKAGTVNVQVNGVTVGAPSPHTIVAQPGVGSIV